MEHCWNREPTARPTTIDVVSSFQRILNGGIDERPLNQFDTRSPSKALHSDAEHPFSVLSAQEEDDAILRVWKCVPADQDNKQPSFSGFDYDDNHDDHFIDDSELASQQGFYALNGEVPLLKDKYVHPSVSLQHCDIELISCRRTPKSERPDISARADTVAGPSHISAVNENIKDSPIVVGSDGDNSTKLGQKRKQSQTVVENGKKQWLVNIVSLLTICNTHYLRLISIPSIA